MNRLFPSLRLAASFAGLTLLALAPSESLMKLVSDGTNPMDRGFQENRGQWDSRALFMASSPGVDVWMTRGGVKFDFNQVSTPVEVKKVGLDFLNRKRSGQVVEMKFLQGAANPTPAGIGNLEAPVNYVGGAVTTTARTFSEARLLGLYSGIDFRLYRQTSYPRFDFIVAAGANPDQIKLRFDGANGVSANGSKLTLATRFGGIDVADLYAYQIVNGKRVKVDCQFRVSYTGVVTFDLGTYDTGNKLIIDPIIYSTLLGAHGGSDEGYAIVADDLGYAYVSGATNARFFPVTNGAYDNTVSSYDCFVTKFEQDASWPVFSTVLGGSLIDYGISIAVDSAGRPVVAGATESTDFPTTLGAPQQLHGGEADGFVATLSNDGRRLLFSTYIGGIGDDVINSMSMDGEANIYVGGDTRSLNLPVTAGALQGAFGGGQWDSFCAKYTRAGALVYASYLGGVNSESIAKVVAVPGGDMVIAGTTGSGNFPTTPNVLDRSMQNQDTFVTRINAAGTGYVFSTFLGGSAPESTNSMAVDVFGFVYVAGGTQSVDFPRTPGVLDDVFGGGGKRFLSKLRPDGQTLAYSTFVPDSGGVSDLEVDQFGVAYMTGTVNFPGTILIAGETDDNTFSGPNQLLTIGDGFVQVINETASAVIYGSYIGGSESEIGVDGYVDPARNVYLAGLTRSYVDPNRTAFPTTAGVFKRSMINDNAPLSVIANFDAYVMKLKIKTSSLLNTFVVAPNLVAGGNSTTGTVNLTQAAPFGGATVSILTSNEQLAIPVDASGNIISSVTIPEGSQTGSFRIQTFDVTTSNAVRFSVSYDGDVLVDDLTIKPWLDGLQVGPTPIVGGTKIAGRIDLLQAAPAGGLIVKLNSSDKTKAQPLVAGAPATTITVPQGATFALFEIQTFGVDFNPGAADGGYQVTISARVSEPNLATVRAKQIRVLPASLQGATLVPSKINEGTSSELTVTLNGQAGPTGAAFDIALGAGAAPVTLSQSTLTIPWGNTSGSITVTAGDITSNQTRDLIVTRTSDPSQTRTVTLSVESISIQSLVLNPSSLLGGGTSVGTVTLSKRATGTGVSIDLTLNPPKGTSPVAFLGQTRLTIPAGSDTAAFTIGTTITNVSKSVTVQASGVGIGTRRALLDVRGLDFTLSLGPTVLVGGDEDATGVVAVAEAAPSGGLTVFLVSSKPSVVAVPDSVVIAEGATSATFTTDTNAVSAQTDVTITARLRLATGDALAQQTLTIVPANANIVTFSIDPSSVVGGTSATGTITLDRVAPTGGVEVLISEDPGATGAAFTTMPTSIVIPAGSKVGKFTIRTTLPSRTVGTTIQVQVGGVILADTLTITR